MLPLIGISTYHRDGEPPAFHLPCTYVDAVRAAGGVPVLLPPGAHDVTPLLDRLDGLILAGGGDLDPAHYGAGGHEAIYMVCAERDRFEMDLLRAAMGRPSLPVLCICRGAQVLNVVSGGTLYVHVPDAFGAAVDHRVLPRLPTRHSVRIDEQARLAAILGVVATDVCSWHHQAIDRIGNDLVAVAWAEDGVVEAVEHQVHPWCFGVQWHPEMQAGEVAQMRLFSALIATAHRG